MIGIPSRRRVSSFVAAVVFLLTLAFAHPALADCPPFPDVLWWKGISHDSVRKYVADKHDGDWNAYIDNWQKKLKFTQDAHAKGSVLIVTVGAAADKIKIRDEQLRSYIDNIEKRIDIIRCLAEITATDEAASPPSEKAKAAARNDAAAGGATAKSAGCSRCHGAAGMSEHPAVPNLAGQNDLYLIKQIKEFQSPQREGGGTPGTIERHNRIMGPRVKNLSDADTWNLAAFYSSRPCGKSKYQAAHVKVAPSTSLTCIKCHGALGESVFPEVPNLAGQNRNYLVKQLAAFRDTADNESGVGEDGRYHYVMAEQARNLSDSVIDELSSFFSGLSCR